MSVAGRSLQKSLAAGPDHPADVLRSHIAAGTCTTEVARICLEACQKAIFTLPRRRRRIEMAAKNIGGLTMQWLLAEDENWSTAVLSDSDLMTLLAYFITAEKRDDLYIRLLKQDLPPSVIQENPHHLGNVWRGATFRALVRAHFLHDCNCDAAPALKLYFRVKDEILALRKLGRSSGHSFASASLWPAEVIIAKELTTGRYLNTGEEDFNRILAIFRGLVKGRKYKHDIEITIANMELVHPGRPRAESALALLHQSCDGKSVAEVQQMMKGTTASGRKAFLVFTLTMDVLRAQGQDVEAKWVEDLRGAVFSPKEQQQYIHVQHPIARREWETLLKRAGRWSGSQRDDIRSDNVK